MKKIISFIALVLCGFIAFVYLGKDTIKTTHQNNKLKPKTQLTTEDNQELLPNREPAPIENEDIPTRKINPERPPQPLVNTPREKLIAPEIKSKPKPDPKVSESKENDFSDSYPIEDAEIYFVPPEQRYPGNLGGPPPLDFPDQEFPDQ